MQRLFLPLFALAIATVAKAQFDGPCGPDSLLETDCYDAATNNTSCTPCYSQYCVTWDLTWGQACDAFCDSPTAPCSPDRVTVTSGAANCTPDLTRCSISYPYLCTLITSETDNCNGELCSQTQGPLYCTNVQPNPGGRLREENHGKTILARIRARARKRAS